jgi:hypothetical protein
MKRRFVTIVATLAVIGMACFQFGVISPPGISSRAPVAQAADIAHSRWARHISGFVLAALAGGIHGTLPPDTHPTTSSGTILPTRNSNGCSQTDGNNVRVNQDCTNQGGSPQNETGIAVNPLDANNLIAGQNDYRRGDSTCGADYSLDGGKHWGDALLPVGYTFPGVDHSGTTAHYWTSAGDPSVAFGTQGVAYYACLVFDRAAPFNDDGCANAPAVSLSTARLVAARPGRFPAASRRTAGRGRSSPRQR